MASKIPPSFRKYVVTKITSKFKEAVELVTTGAPHLGPKDILIKNKYVGINASDVNYTAARYDPGVKVPFDCGFEGIGTVVAAGDKCSTAIGQSVAYMNFGAFSEYVVIPEKIALPVPAVKPEFVSLLVSGLTASIALDKVGEIKSGETVLVTAAAGGTGQFAVQWAKKAGCHVIGTCSSDEKVEFLRSIGCDRPINYNKESLKEVLKSEYRKGVDVIYESVGGDTFETAFNALAQKGRCIVIGMISGYESQEAWKPNKLPAIPVQLLTKSASLRGFLLFQFPKELPEYLMKLVSMTMSGDMKPGIDMGANSSTGQFIGIESIPKAVAYMYEKKNVGKIIVDIESAKSNL